VTNQAIFAIVVPSKSGRITATESPFSLPRFLPGTLFMIFKKIIIIRSNSQYSDRLRNTRKITTITIFNND